MSRRHRDEVFGEPTCCFDICISETTLGQDSFTSEVSGILHPDLKVVDMHDPDRMPHPTGAQQKSTIRTELEARVEKVHAVGGGSETFTRLDFLDDELVVVVGTVKEDGTVFGKDADFDGIFVGSRVIEASIDLSNMSVGIVGGHHALCAIYHVQNLKGPITKCDRPVEGKAPVDRGSNGGAVESDTCAAVDEINEAITDPVDRGGSRATR